MGKLNLTIPDDSHQKLKIFAAKKGIKLVPKAEELLIKAIENLTKEDESKDSRSNQS